MHSAKVNKGIKGILNLFTLGLAAHTGHINSEIPQLKKVQYALNYLAYKSSVHTEVSYNVSSSNSNNTCLGLMAFFPGQPG